MAEAAQNADALFYLAGGGQGKIQADAVVGQVWVDGKGGAGHGNHPAPGGFLDKGLGIRALGQPAMMNSPPWARLKRTPGWK